MNDELVPEAPVLAFSVLAWLWLARGGSAPALARNHLRQTFFVSLWGAAILLVACTGFIVAFGLHSEWTWTYVVVYFTCVHSTLIIFGVLGLSKAMAGKPFRYPLIGPRDV